MCSHEFTQIAQGQLVSGRTYYLYRCTGCGRDDLGIESFFSMEQRKETEALMPWIKVRR